MARSDASRAVWSLIVGVIARPRRPAAGGRVTAPASSAPAAAAAPRRPRRRAVTARPRRPAGPRSERRRRHPLVRRSRHGRAARTSIGPSRQFVDAFNNSPDGRLHLARDLSTTRAATTSLKTQIAAGNAPDIIGPIGVRGLQSFGDQLLDLQPLHRADGRHCRSIDRSADRRLQASTASRSASRSPSTRRSSTTTRTCSTRPAWPTRRTRSATSTTARTGTWATVRELAMKLTVDKNGNDATSADFDPDEHRPVGPRRAVHRQRRPRAGRRSSAAPARSSRTTARPPSSPTTGGPVSQYYYDGDLEGPLHPERAAVDGDLLDGGNAFQSGQIAMDVVAPLVHLLRLPRPRATPPVTDWDIAVAARRPRRQRSPRKLHADTFGILAARPHPDEAFEVLSYLVGVARADHTSTAPCRPIQRQQDAFFDRRSTTEDLRPTRASTGRSPRTCSTTRTSPATSRTCRTSSEGRRREQGPRVQVLDHRRARRRRGDRHARRPSSKGIFDEAP